MFRKLLSSTNIVAMAIFFVLFCYGVPSSEILLRTGRAFLENDYFAVVWFSVPVLALSEMNGIKRQSKIFVEKFEFTSPSLIIIMYYAFRCVSSALGLSSIGGHVQIINPVIIPMLERKCGYFNSRNYENMMKFLVAEISAADNIANFFGQMLFVGVSAVLLLQNVLQEQHINIEAQNLVISALPVVVFTLSFHFLRLILIHLYLTYIKG